MKLSLRSLRTNLKSIVLNSDYNYDLDIYRIIENHHLDFYLKKIDNVPVINESTGERISSREQVIRLLNRLIVILKEDLITSLPIESYVVEIITSIPEKIEEYFKLKCCVNSASSNNLITTNIYKIITFNFYNNRKYIPELHSLFDKLGINYNNTQEDLLKTKTLLVDIINCNRNEYDTIYLFSNIESTIKNQQKRNTVKLTDEDIKIHVIENYKYIYSTLLKNYFKKIKHLKYLK